MATAKKDRVAFITGGASGIGLAAAEDLLAHGWRVAIADMNQATLDAVFKRKGPDQVLRIPLNVTDEAAVKAAIALTKKTFGRLDGVLNSAGIAADIPLLDHPVDLLRKILDVNVAGTFLVAREAARVMVKQKGGGSIVNVASVSGMKGNRGRAGYGASKGAVITMTYVMAVDLATAGVRVNAVAPGPIETAMVREIHTAESRAAWHREVPMRRYGQPAEMAGAIRFLLDPDMSSFVTGQVIAVDGGFSTGGLLRDD